MSTILDALSRAERERRMGQMPAIEHALLERAASGPQLPRQRRNWMPVAIGATALSAVALTAILVFVLHEPGVAPDPGPAAPAAPVAAESPAPQPTPVAVKPKAPPPQAAAESPATRPAASPRRRVVHEPVTAEPAPAQAVSAPPESASRSASAHKPVAVAKPQAATASPPPALPMLSELPAATRQELPPISLGGYIYSANPADRSILINGKLLREGDQLAPGLRLEQMRSDGVVLGYKDLRFRMNY